ncbi:MAG: guanylate kinase [Sphingomonas sp.]|nr:guanylate kinase [Sphingomonas sp.]
MDPSPTDPESPPSSPQRRGLLVVLSSPSGAGKTTISRLLMAADPAITMSVSATTRPMRPGEVDGHDYQFVDDARFQNMVEASEFAEYATVFNHRYGTPAAPVRAAVEAGRDILFDIDWQGARQLEASMDKDLITIFLLPPSIAELERRLRARGTDNEAVIASRMQRAADEIDHWAEYNYVLINEERDICLAQVRTIIAGERLKRSRQSGLNDFVRTLVSPA